MDSSNRKPTAAGFVEGWVTQVELLAGIRFVWWGTAESGQDLIGTQAGRVVAADSAAALIEAVLLQGWSDEKHFGRVDGSRLDLRPAQCWIRSGGCPDCGALLDLWNFAEDVLRSTSGNLLTSGRITDGLYNRLAETVVSPFLRPNGRDGTGAGWTAYDLDRLKQVAGRAEAVVQSALFGPDSGPTA